jgi:hypothetical protein
MFLGSMVTVATLVAIDRDSIQLHSNKIIMLLSQAFLTYDKITKPSLPGAYK